MLLFLTLLFVGCMGKWKEEGQRVLSGETIQYTMDLEKNPPPMAFQIGEQKCGSTTLFDMMNSHSQTCHASILDGERSWDNKELELFKDSRNLYLKFPHYMEHFTNCSSELLRMDATPGYLSREEVPSRIKEFYTTLGIDTDKIKFYGILRDPAARVVSAYQHYRRKDWLTNERLDEVIDQGIKDYEKKSELAHLWGKLYSSNSSMVGRGVYAPHIRNWFRFFKPSQFLFLTLEQLRRDTRGTMAHLHAFLGLKNEDLSLKHSNQGSYESPPLPQKLVDFYKPHNQELMILKDEHPGAFLDYPGNPFNFEANA